MPIAPALPPPPPRNSRAGLERRNTGQGGEGARGFAVFQTAGWLAGPLLCEGAACDILAAAPCDPCRRLLSLIRSEAGSSTDGSVTVSPTPTLTCPRMVCPA